MEGMQSLVMHLLSGNLSGGGGAVRMVADNIMQVVSEQIVG